ncbi:hypothetical protein N0V90_013201 [Kalmusia sp. IMI 367209]|nr:hypothetical protein N0V90_013201 [Kalmusia sp. IMI 367209]
MSERVRTSKGRPASDNPPLSESGPSTDIASTSKKTFPFGIKLLHDGEDSIVDIIFVHGLTGDREETWKAQNVADPWPKTLLPSAVPNARVLTFGYDAYTTDWRDVVSMDKISSYAKDLLATVTAYREHDNTALVEAVRGSESLEQVINCTRGIVFFGTPYHGSSRASWVASLADVIGMVKQTQADILTDLQSELVQLEQLQTAFHSLVSLRNKFEPTSIQITCCYEELALKGVGIVVPFPSATFPSDTILPSYTSIGIRSNHINMTKFEGRDDPGFVAVAAELRRWTSHLARAQIAGAQSEYLERRMSGEHSGFIRELEALCEPFVPAEVEMQYPFPAGISSLETLFEPAFQKQDIRLFRIKILHRTHPVSPQNPGVPAIIFSARIRQVDASRIQNCLDDIILICHEVGVDLPVEIVDNEYFKRTSSVVTPEEASDWIEVSSQLIKDLQLTCPKYNLRVETIDLLRRGDSGDDSSIRLTIVIGSPDGDNRLWNHVIEELQYLTPKYYIEIVYSNGILLYDEERDQMDPSAHEDTINMGASISRNGDLVTGTIGGSIELEICGKSSLFALTNYHVVVNEALHDELGKSNALHPDSSLLRDNQMRYNSPSERDHEIRMERLRNNEKAYEDIIQASQAKGPIAAEIKAKYEPWLNKARQDTAHAANFNRHVGSLAAASGRRLVSRPDGSEGDKKRGPDLLWFLDWAILKVDPPRRHDNAVTNLPDFNPSKSTLQYVASANEWVKLSVTQARNVAFRGRSSGWKLGRVNPAVTIIDPDTSKQPSKHPVLHKMERDANDIAKNYDIPLRSHAYCWSFVPRYGDDKVVRPGDSGSIVILDEKEEGDKTRMSAEWVGLLFGESGANQGYMIPIDLVLEDIGKVMGGASVTRPTMSARH